MCTILWLHLVEGLEAKVTEQVVDLTVVRAMVLDLATGTGLIMDMDMGMGLIMDMGMIMIMDMDMDMDMGMGLIMDMGMGMGLIMDMDMDMIMAMDMDMGTDMGMGMGMGMDTDMATDISMDICMAIVTKERGSVMGRPAAPAAATLTRGEEKPPEHLRLPAYDNNHHSMCASSTQCLMCTSRVFESCLVVTCCNILCESLI
ncbi:uncharacterized protein LOC117755262 [Hippoglossus hippoglossus]|uniref:uncharacterized protein LOC117755262 n=1 Tax=Hippoglossus hippoglossus TaxID=8267 RepID=UPI00148DF998|nr:uncharacterized protein LOC117755262 [Hippoglossus hippoglossus]